MVVAVAKADDERWFLFGNSLTTYHAEEEKVMGRVAIDSFDRLDAPHDDRILRDLAVAGPVRLVAAHVTQGRWAEVAVRRRPRL